MKIAVMVSGAASETLQAAPLLSALRRGLPDADITLATPRSGVLYGRRIEGPDRVVGLRMLDRNPRLLSSLAGWRWLRRQRIEIVVICSDRLSVRLVGFLAGVPRRVGTASGHSSPLFSDHRRRGRHENRAASWLRLAAVMGIATDPAEVMLTITQAASDTADVLLIGAGLDPDRMLVGMTPGLAEADAADVSHRRLGWMPERYAHLGNQLELRHGANIVLLGPEADRAQVDATMVDLGARHVDLCGQLNLDETIAVISRCDLLVTTNSPLLQIAAAVATPSVGLFGPTDGGRRGAMGAMHRVIQALPQRAHRRAPRPSPSLQEIRVEDVLAGIETVQPEVPATRVEARSPGDTEAVAVHS